MRRNIQLVILLSVFLVILKISTTIYDGTTLPNTVHSVSRLTGNFSIFVPTSSKYRTTAVTRAADGKIPMSRKIQPRHSRKFNAPIRPKVKAAKHLNDHKHKKKQRFAKFAKQAKKDDSKTLRKRIKLSHSAVESIPNAGSNQVLQTTTQTRIDQNYARVVITLPNYQNTGIESKSQGRDRARNMSLSDDRVNSNTKFSPMLQKQHATTLWNGSGKTRSTLETRSGVRVIIAAYGRSGSSFFGGIFNAHPDFFFMYEPLYQLKNIVNRDTNEYIESVEYIVNAIFNCDFEDNRFLEIKSRADFHRASSRPLVSPPFCNTDYEKAINFIVNHNWKLCNGKISANALNRIRHKHANIASKILLERIEPVDLSWFLSVSAVSPSSSEIQSIMPVKQVYVLYLVRDPRAMLYSRHRLGWIVPRERNQFAFESGEVDENVKKFCDMIELNLWAVLRHPSRIKLVRYEELVTNPEEVVRHLFKELHISPSKEVFRWIYSKTHGPVDLSANSLSRNANSSINYWRKKIPSKLLEITEKRCARVMKYLGYLSSNGSQEVLNDLRTPLHLNKIRDLKENYRFPAM